MSDMGAVQSLLPLWDGFGGVAQSRGLKTFPQNAFAEEATMGESNVAQFHGFLFVTVVNMSVVTAIAKSSPSHSGINVELAKTFPQKKT